MNAGGIAVALHWVWLGIRSVIITGVALVTPVVAVAVAVALLVLSPLPGSLPEAKSNPVGRPTVLLAADGTVLAQLRGFDLNLPTTTADLTDDVVAAVVSAEDRNFFDHTGVDVTGIARAVRENLGTGRVVQGGSTITQQLVKNRYLGNRVSADRKVREAILAQRIETEMTKDEILLAYLSEAYFGSGAYGLAAAAEVYFAKPVADLDLSEVAMIVGMLPSPTGYSPHVDLTAAEAARLRTLTAMVDNDMLDEARYAEAAARPLVLADGDPAESGTSVQPLQGSELGPWPHFTRYVEEYLLETLGREVVYGEGLVVQTTLVPARQDRATSLVQGLAQRSGDPTVGSALAAVAPTTGYIEVLATSNDWAVSEVNLATGGDSGFQAGSSVKPFVLASVLESGTAPSVTVSAPTVYTTADGTGLRNFGGAAGGTLSIRQAIVNSYNTHLLVLAERQGPANVAALARRLGIDSWGPDRDYGVSIALGAYETSPLQMAGAFGVFAQRGVRYPPVPVVTATTAAGDVVLDNRRPAGTPVLDPVVADHVNDVLVDVVQRGTGTGARLGDRPVAGKTGTAEAFSSAWFVGYTPQLSAAVWVGHVDGVRPLPPLDGVREITGGSVPATLWRQFMGDALRGQPPAAFTAPEPLGGPRPSPAGGAKTPGTGGDDAAGDEVRPITVQGAAARRTPAATP